MSSLTIHCVAVAVAIFCAMMTLAAPAGEQVVMQLPPAQSPFNADFLWPRSLTDTGSSFGISKSIKTETSILRKYGNWTVLVGKYPKGSYAGAKIAGFIFDAATNLDLSNAKEVVLSYDVQFVSGFAWALGGKLPGLFGGDTFSLGVTCSGGNHDDRCWSARLMWRDVGKGELYGYFPSVNKGKPFCEGQCGNEYGASLGRGAWKFTSGNWVSLQERVKLNDVGKSNGEIEVYVNGKSVIKKTGITLRTTSKGRIRGVMMHTFFGGSSTTRYQSPKYQEAAFRKFNIKVTQKLS